MHTTLQLIFQQAKLKLEADTGLIIQVDKLAVREGPDVLVFVAGQPMALEIKRRIPTNLGVLLDLARTTTRPLLVCAEYINPMQAEKLKAANVQFIDTVGNAYIKQLNCFIFSKGNKPDAPLKDRHEVVNRAFEPTGLKVIYAFLTKPELVTAPYREIAQYTGVALGAIGRILDGLKAVDFLVDMRGVRTLTNTKRLLNRWAEAYIDRLRPKLFVGIYETDMPEWWKTVALENYGGWMGGERAAAEVTGALRPEQTIMYLPAEAEQAFFIAARLQQVKQLVALDKAQLITIYRPFWLEAPPGRAGYAHPVLVYADLLATADPRNLEVAERLYEEHIH